MNTVAWTETLAGSKCNYDLTLSFYLCADAGAPDGGSGCVRTTACTPPSVTVDTIAVTSRTTASVTTSIDIGACVPPSVFPLSFELDAASGVQVALSVQPAPPVNGLKPCDVDVEVLQADSAGLLSCTSN